MNISVRYSPDLKGVVRLAFFMIRRSMRVFVALGVLLIVLGVLYWGQLPGLAPVIVGCGIGCITGRPLRAWVDAFRYRKRLGEVEVEVEVTLTSEGV